MLEAKLHSDIPKITLILQVAVEGSVTILNAIVEDVAASSTWATTKNKPS